MGGFLEEVAVEPDLWRHIRLHLTDKREQHRRGKEQKGQGPRDEGWAGQTTMAR